MPRSDASAMRHALRRLRGAVLTASCILTLTSSTGSWAGPSVRAFAVDSEPPGAEVFTITGRVGTTPAFVSERDIYPNTYPEQKLDEYGTVILRRDGCAEYRKHITLEDLKRGIKAQLKCQTENTKSPQPPVVTATTVTAGPNPPPVAAQPPAPEPTDQRIRWLRTIEELREHNLLSTEEERRIRRRILGGD